jgi:hypothetical protein
MAFSLLTFRGSPRTPKLKAPLSPASFTLAFAVALTLNALPLTAAEPILTLAMAKSDSSNYRLQKAKDRATPSSPVSATPRFNETSVRTLAPLARENIKFSTTLLLQKPEREVTSPLTLTRKTLRADHRVGTWARTSLQAGFGDIFYDKVATAYGRTGTGCEEPSCGYLKIHLRF